MQDNNIISSFIHHKRTIFAFLIAFMFLGIIGFFLMHQNLFPDTDRPQISVVIIERGASAKDMAENIATIVERELYTLDKIRKVSSVSKDEVAVITAEFEYEKNLGDAATDVNNALNKIKSKLPKDIEPPQIYKVSSATPPVIVLSISPKNNSISLADVRQIADNQIKDKILKIKGVGNVDVFGGYQKEVFIEINKNKLNKYNLSLGYVIGQIQKYNADIPVGFVINEKNEFLIKSNQKATKLSDFKNIFLTKDIRLTDIAKIKYNYKENNSLYFGNGKKAVAVAVERTINGSVLDTINSVKKIIPDLKKEFPMLNIQISDTQEKIIKQSNINMLESLRDAIIMTGIVVFFFLANFSQLIIVGASIPFVYIITIAIMWLMGMEFNIVTLTAVILALGLLIDDAVVIVENIERHYFELKKDIKKAVIEGTREVMLADFAGTFTTIIMLVPILFVGDYPQRIFRPFVSTLIISLFVSYFVSITFIPIISGYFLKKSQTKNFIENISYKFSQMIIQPFTNFVINIVQTVLKRKIIFLPLLIPLIMIFIMCMKKVAPIIGEELMPPMDTGIVKANIVFDSNLSIYQVANRVEKISKLIGNDKRVLMSSIAVGSEPGVLTMGKGKSPQSVTMTIHYINRFKRKDSIWKIEDNLKRDIQKLPDIKYVEVFDYGATPLSTIKGNLDVLITGSNIKTIDKIGNEVLNRCYHVKGIKSLSRTWDLDKVSYNLEINKRLANYYGLTPYDIAEQLNSKINGRFVSLMNVENEDSLKIRVIYPANGRDSLIDLDSYYIDTKKGKIPVSTFITTKKIIEPTVITREKLNYSLDIIGYRSKAAISHIISSYKKTIKGYKLPPGYSLSNEGDVKQMKNSMSRMMKSFLIGVMLLFLSLVPTFNSFKSPVAVIIAIPLSMIGGIIALLFMGYHKAMPAMMGLILLSGIIVNNSILLIDFIQTALKNGMPLNDAIINSIKIRIRPVLMTAFGTSVGMIPIAFGWALGLERLAPLGTVAIGGLLIGTLLTLIYVPLFYFFMVKARRKKS
jgi:multidrug efflux pump subunit AcrB